MAPKQDADLFNKIIAEGRERQKNEALANAMLLGGRRSSAPSGGGIRRAGAGTGSLASRVGISKTPRVNSPLSRPSSATPSNSFRSNSSLQSRTLNRTTSDSRLDRKARALQALGNGGSNTNLRNQVNVRENASNGSGFSFRGQAHGEWITVVAQNFAPGTTSADIESVLQPMVNEDVVCKIVAAKPTVIAEMSFKDRNNADTVVTKFNNQKADGRQLYVYIKDGGNAPSALSNAPSGPRSDRNDRGRRQHDDDEMMDVEEDRRRYDEQRRHDEERRHERRGADVDYQDGRYGFEDPHGNSDDRPAQSNRDRSDRGLYSDSIAGPRRGGGGAGGGGSSWRGSRSNRGR